MTTGIRVEGVSASYRNKQVLFDVSCQAQPGEITALLGPNGSGKSTLLKAALGLIPASGEIHINGQSLDSLAPAQRAREVAYVPQRTQLMARLSVTEVVELGRFAHRGPLAVRTAADREAVELALESAGVASLATRSFLELSGGERQRVLLARALATGSKTLLLDEPTSALDVRQVLSIHRVLRRLAEEGCCILVVLHGLFEAYQNADQAVLLHQGRVQQQGAVAEVLRSDVVEAVYGVRMEAASAWKFSLPEEGE